MADASSRRMNHHTSEQQKQQVNTSEQRSLDIHGPWSSMKQDNFRQRVLPLSLESSLRAPQQIMQAIGLVYRRKIRRRVVIAQSI